jgi:TP901 family phage tail tape measure protein
MADGVNLGSAYGEIQIGTDGATQSVNSLASSLRSAGAAMSAAVTLPLVGVGVAAVNSAGEFEQSMNVMAQVSAATAGEMASLQAQALEMGAVTSFSAGEAAQAQLELAKAGMKPAEVMAALPGVLDMAAAGNLGLAQSASIAANAVNTFGLDASATTEVANMLAAAANASSVDITDLASGMTMAGAVFSSTGQSLDNLNIAMALLGNNGITGSDAGTSLKTALMRLTAPTDEAAAALASLGVNVYDAQGNMLDFPVILADLEQALTGTNAVTVTSSNLTAEQAERMEYLEGTISKTQRQLADYAAGIAGVAQSENDKVVAQDRLNRVLTAAQAEYAQLASIGGTTSTVMKQLTEEERQQALATIFGADAIRSISVLMAEGTEGWEEMAAAVGVSGAASATAGARMKGMRGAVEYLKGSIDSFLITAALPFLDGMSGVVRIVADGISAIGNLPRPVLDAAIAFAAVLAAAGPLMLAISGIAGAVGFLLSPVGLLVAGVAALAAGFVLWQQNVGGIQGRAAAFAGTLKDMAESVTGIDFDGVADGLRSFGKYLGAVSEDGDYLNDWLTHLPTPIQPAVMALGQLVAAFGGLVQTGNFDAFVQSIQAVDWGGLLASAAAGLNGLKDGMVAALKGIDWAGALATAADWLDGLKTGVVSAIQSVPWAEALAAAGDFLAGLWGNVTAALGRIPWAAALATVGDWLAGLRTGIVNRITTINWGGLLMQAGDYLANLWGNVTGALARIPWANAIAAAGDWLAALRTNVATAIQGIDWQGALTTAGNAFAGLETAVAGGLRGLGFEDAAGKLDNLRRAVTGLPAALTETQGAMATFGAQTAAALAPVAAFFAPALSRLQATFANLPTSLAPLLPKLEALGSAFGELLTALQPFLFAVGAGLALAMNFGIERLSTAFDSLPELLGPIIDQVTAIIRLIAAVLTEVVAGVSAIFAGDWAAAWESGKGIVTAFGTFFRGLFSRLGTFMGAAARNMVEPILNTFSTLGVDITPTLERIRKTFEDVWAKVLTYIQPVIDLVGSLTTVIDEFKDFLSSLQLPNPFAALAAAADAVRNALGEFGAGVVTGVTGGGQPAPAATEDGTAGGASYFPGGLTAINERGYEQIVLPAGSRVYTAGQTNNLPTSGKRAININLGGVTVNSPMDARRLATLLRDQLVMEGV